MARLPAITIDGVKYPCDEWRRAQAGRVIRDDWQVGFIDGMGSVTRRSNRDYYVSNGMDASAYPYLRLRPQKEATISLTTAAGGRPFGENASQGVFHFVEQASNGANMLFILNGNTAWKIQMSNNTLDTTGSFQPRLFTAAGGVTMGRPAFFDGSWYAPFSLNTNAQKLDAGNVAVFGGGADGWTDVGIRAIHFARLQDRDTSKLARAFFVGAEGNRVSISSDGSTWTGDTFEVGDGGLVISDMLTTAGNAELVITRADGIFLFDKEGNSRRIQEFVGQGLSGLSAGAPYDGVNSYVHGPLFFWCHSSGFWRVQGDSALPVGPQSDPEWTNLTLDGFTPFTTGAFSQWNSVQAWGQWIYATYGDSLFYGRIVEDARIHWHGVLYRVAGSVLKCFITEATSTDNPDLWVTDTLAATVTRFALDADGSPRTPFGSKRGTDTETFQHWLPKVNSGEVRELVQWRFMWALTENWVSTASLQLAAHMEGAALSTNIGSAYATTEASLNRHTAAWTVGSSDTAFEIQPTLKVTLSGYSSSSSDPRIRAFGVEGVTAAIYSVRIPLMPDELKGYSVGVRDGLKKLRDLVSAPAINIREPGFDSTFSGYIKDVDEVAVAGEGPGSTGYIVTLQVQRWDWNTAS